MEINQPLHNMFPPETGPYGFAQITKLNNIIHIFPTTPAACRSLGFPAYKVSIMHIEYTKHAELKIKERRIPKSEVNAIINDSEELLLDIETGNLVAVGNMQSRPDHNY